MVQYLEDDCESSQSDIDIGLVDISDIIDCLLRLSVAIRNPAPHDQYISRAGAEKLNYYEQYDINHVHEKFPGLAVELMKRLGVAMTSRRHFFRYREDHYARISGGIDDEDGLMEDRDQTTIVSSIPGYLKDTPGEPTLIDLDVHSITSETSYAPSLDNDEEIRVPPIPQEDSTGSFLCPFCYLMIKVDSRKEWK